MCNVLVYAGNEIIVICDSPEVWNTLNNGYLTFFEYSINTINIDMIYLSCYDDGSGVI